MRLAFGRRIVEPIPKIGRGPVVKLSTPPVDADLPACLGADSSGLSDPGSPALTMPVSEIWG